MVIIPAPDREAMVPLEPGAALNRGLSPAQSGECPAKPVEGGVAILPSAGPGQMGTTRQRRKTTTRHRIMTTSTSGGSRRRRW
jgi:hypothetical protein